MAKNKGGCGLCGITFISIKERDAHFKSEQHLKTVNDPKIMQQKIAESQLGVVNNIIKSYKVDLEL